jgi:hypothetical protein
MHPQDPQLEPETGLKVTPLPSALENYVLRLAPTRPESERIWNSLPPIPGANRFGAPKPGAIVLAQTPQGDPLFLAQETGRGRVLAFGGETWVWYRATPESQAAYLRFWRQAILWLTHKEAESDNQVLVKLDRRRVPQGGKLEITASARDPKGDPLENITLVAEVKRDGPDTQPESVSLFGQAAESKGSYFATATPGDYRVTVKALQNGAEIGSDSARFLVFQDDRELENPAADLALLREIATASGGATIAPEALGDYLKTLDKQIPADYVTMREERLWDRWPFLLLFTSLLALEWIIRKRIGWV